MSSTIFEQIHIILPISVLISIFLFALTSKNSLSKKNKRGFLIINISVLVVYTSVLLLWGVHDCKDLLKKSEPTGGCGLFQFLTILLFISFQSLIAGTIYYFIGFRNRKGYS
jgi:hypothetical protein